MLFFIFWRLVEGKSKTKVSINNFRNPLQRPYSDNFDPDYIQEAACDSENCCISRLLYILYCISMYTLEKINQ